MIYCRLERKIDPYKKRQDKIDLYQHLSKGNYNINSVTTILEN